MIVITGATGQLGSLIVASLLERVPAQDVGVSVRDPSRAADLAERGIRVRRGDFGEPDSLADAFEGAGQVLIVSANETGGKLVAAHRAAIDAARTAGAKRILYTSHQGAAADSMFAPMPDHAATEAYLAAAGTPFTALRNGFYATTRPVGRGRHPDHADRSQDPPHRRRRRGVGGGSHGPRDARRAGGDAAWHVPRGPAGRVRRHQPGPG